MEWWFLENRLHQDLEWNILMQSLFYYFLCHFLFSFWFHFLQYYNGLIRQLDTPISNSEYTILLTDVSITYDFCFNWKLRKTRQVKTALLKFARTKDQVYWTSQHYPIIITITAWLLLYCYIEKLTHSPDSDYESWLRLRVIPEQNSKLY